MRSLLFGNWWSALKIEQQIFWSLAIVFSLLSIILFLLDRMGYEQEAEVAKVKQPRIIDARLVLIFLTSFGWASVLFSSFSWIITSILLFSSFTALLVSFLQGLVFGFPWRKQFDVQILVESTGQVLQPIPPHKNGMGKVHLDIRKKSYELNALTTGRELREGVPVRVVDITEENILIVEAIEPKSPGH